MAHSAVGAAGAHTTGTTTGTYPFASPVKDTVAVLLVEVKPSSLQILSAVGPDGVAMPEIGPPGGFTGGTGAAGPDTGPVRVQAFLRICTGAEATGNATVTLSGTAAQSSLNGRVVQATHTGGAIDADATGGADNTAASNWSVTMGAVLDARTGDLCYSFCGAPTDTPLPTFGGSALTATGATFANTFVANPISASGDDTGGRIESWTVSGAATGAATHTVTLTGTTTNWAGAEILVRLREVPAQPVRAQQAAVMRAVA